MTCREFVDWMKDYVPGLLPETQRALFDEHKAACDPCSEFLESYNDTIAAERVAWDDPEAEECREECPAELARAIRAALRNKPA
jgi:anti-sigma factor RsiW